jgi:hypothetical protein
MAITASWWVAPALIVIVLGLVAAALCVELRHAYEVHFRESRHEHLFLSCRRSTALAPL